MKYAAMAEGFFDVLSPCKTAKFHPKGFLMKKFFLALFAALVGLTQNASAALTAADVDMTAATSDMAIVFIAILGVSVIAFGYRQIRSMIK